MEYYGTTIKGYETSEQLREIEITHFASKLNPARYAKKTAEEKQELKTRMYAHPAKNHSPVGFN